ncbi:hypothetical protein H4219_003202 [Mycoemilia scoparia]|uniref:Queuosine 5'-phosphate N-glycosylase/hydrolase n=1 Tax=Mycoemilia scoparia TaxID=417184 RepID=A0A9W8DTR0_9FUNG|nr:hypothetical protein H4219_003202 [Mycoemilia scoparia]
MPVTSLIHTNQPSSGGFKTRVLASAKYINENSKDVTVPLENIDSAARKIYARIQQLQYSKKSWKCHPLNPKVADKSAIDWIFVVDTLNFSFWSDQIQSDKKYAVTLDGVKYKGYWSLCACINRALREGIPITDPKYYSGISRNEFDYVFRQDEDEGVEPIPMADDRYNVLREAGKVIMSKFGGSFSNCLVQSQNSAIKLLELIVSNFESYQDEHTFNMQKVYIYKRAQILVADLWACFEGEGVCSFDDIDCITMFADYRVPQALVHFGLLKYSQSLYDTLRDGEDAVEEGRAGDCLLPSGSQLEVEIRGNSIWAVDLVRRKIIDIMRQEQKEGDAKSNGSQPHINAIILDFYIWDYAKEHEQQLKDIPIHHTRSVYY